MKNIVKNTIVRIVMFSCLFSLLCASSILGQEDNQSASEESFAEKFEKADPHAYRVISDLASDITDFNVKLQFSKRNALENVTKKLILTENLPDAEFNHGEIWLKTGLNITAAIIDFLIKDSFPYAGVILQAGEKAYDEYVKEPQKVSAEYDRIKSKNDLIILLNNVGNLINESYNNFETDHRDNLLEKYADLIKSNPGRRDSVLNEIEKLRKYLKSNPIGKEDLELMCYQILLKEMHSSHTKNSVGYMEVYTYLPQIYDMSDSHNGRPMAVKISIKTGNKDLNEKFEKNINELINSNKTKYNSVLELELITKYNTLVTSYGSLRGASTISLTPVVASKDVTLQTWDNFTRHIRYKTHAHIDPSLIKFGKETGKHLMNSKEKNMRGVLYTKLFPRPFRYVMHKKSKFPVFKAYKPHEY